MFSAGGVDSLDTSGRNPDNPVELHSITLNIIELQLNSKKRKLEQFLRMLLIHLASIPEKSHRAGRYPLLRLWLCFRDIWQFGFLQHPVHLAGENHAKEM
jgi:hypothetical protein